MLISSLLVVKDPSEAAMVNLYTLSPLLSPGFAKSGALVKDKFPESEIVNNELSVPDLDKLTSSPSASLVEISKTFVWPLVTSISVTRSLKIGALSFKFVIVTENSGDVAVSDPSDATTFNLYILSLFESVGIS